jgi:hypothetical protein
MHVSHISSKLILVGRSVMPSIMYDGLLRRTGRLTDAFSRRAPEMTHLGVIAVNEGAVRTQALWGRGPSAPTAPGGFPDVSQESGCQRGDRLLGSL